MKGRFCFSKRGSVVLIGLIFILSVLFLFRSILFLTPTLNTKAAPQKNNPSVVGGTDVKDPNKWPFMVYLITQAVETAELFFNSCGGTLIAPNWILTAGHCVTNVPINSRPLRYEDGDKIFQISGTHNVGTVDERMANLAQTEIKNYKVHLHPGYSFGDVSRKSNDIALIELENPILGIPVISIQADKNLESEGTLGVILGWGTSSNDFYPKFMQQGIVPILANTTANSPTMYGRNPNLILVDTEIAAGFESGKTSICKGDSGGPLLVWNGFNWIQVGISAWGSDIRCDLPNSPGVFTRLSSYTAWIIDVISKSKHNDVTTGSTPFVGKMLSINDINEFCKKSKWKDKLPLKCKTILPGR